MTTAEDNGEAHMKVLVVNQDSTLARHPSAPFLTVASNDLKTRIFLFDVLDHVDLEDGVSLGRVLGPGGGSGKIGA